MEPSTGPTLLGVNVIWVATILSAVATLAVIVAIYAATTVRDPMARRVKALHQLGRPVLIGTRSVAASEKVSQLLTDAGLPHQAGRLLGAQTRSPAAAHAHRRGQ